MITLVLRHREQCLFGHLAQERPEFLPSELGLLVEKHFWQISNYAPELKVWGVQLMPDHLHGALETLSPMSRPLGEQIRGFKAGATKIARSLGILSPGESLFAEGFVDTILLSDAERESALTYMAENPKRLWTKRHHPELFKVINDLTWQAPEDGRKMHFSAIGNQFLLNYPEIIQVQCARADFEYLKNAHGELQKDLPPLRKSDAFQQKLKVLLDAAARGAVLICPCISHGEKEIARRVFEAGHRLIVLANKGFGSFSKPAGKMFDQCADGRLLILAPINWPYTPGKKEMTRQDACVLNRIAQLIAGKGAAEIQYHGSKLEDIENLTNQAIGTRRFSD